MQRGRQQEKNQGEEFHEEVVKINRCAKVVKGGRRFSFSALLVVGDGEGKVGVGFGKANDVPTSIEKGLKEGRRAMVKVARKGTTIPHRITARHGAASVLLLPAPRGTGVIAGASVRSVLVAAGIHDVLTKSQGGNNPLNLVKATWKALRSLRTKAEIEALRGVELGEVD